MDSRKVWSATCRTCVVNWRRRQPLDVCSIFTARVADPDVGAIGIYNISRSCLSSCDSLTSVPLSAAIEFSLALKGLRRQAQAAADEVTALASQTTDALSLQVRSCTAVEVHAIRLRLSTVCSMH